MQREYEEFKVRINGLVSMAQKVPDDGWTMQDGTPWPGNKVHDHPGMTQVRIFCSHIQIYSMSACTSTSSYCIECNMTFSASRLPKFGVQSYAVFKIYCCSKERWR